MINIYDMICAWPSILSVETSTVFSTISLKMLMSFCLSIMKLKLATSLLFVIFTLSITTHLLFISFSIHFIHLPC